MLQAVWTTLAYLAVVSVCSTTTGAKIEPSKESALENAYQIFNGIHSVGRLWGTAVHHNGFALIPGVVPAGTVLYHGSGGPEIPAERQWLAFEVEHAEVFSKRYLKRPGQKPRNGGAPNKRDQKLLAARPLPQCDRHAEKEAKHGHLHTFQAKRDLNVLILDGMSAASSCSEGRGAGGGDAFYLLLRHADGIPDTSFQQECHAEDDIDDPDSEWSLSETARKGCKAAKKLGFDAVLRSEAGFELIYCDFAGDGLDLISSVPQIRAQHRLADEMKHFSQWTKAVTRKYDGIGRDRLRIDFSSMVSGFFFPFNYSSPLPGKASNKRLMAVSEENFVRLYEYALGALHPSSTMPAVNWQAVAESIVDRYADKLFHLVSPDIPTQDFIAEVEAVAMTNLPASESATSLSERAKRMSKAVDDCTRLYLLPVLASRERWSLADELVYTSTETVARSICQDYHHIYSLLLDLATARETTESCQDKSLSFDTKETQDAIVASQDIIRKLMARLEWSDWHKPRQCPPEEFLYIAMPPLGVDNDNRNPGCRTAEYIEAFPYGYW